MCWRLVEYTFDDLAKKDAGAWDGDVSVLSGVCSPLVKPQNPPTGFFGGTAERAAWINATN